MPEGVGIVWHNVREFGTACEKLSVEVELAAKKAGLVAGRELVMVTAAAAPKGATGKLAGSIEMRAVSISSTPVVQVGPTIVYGRRNDLGFKGRRSPRGVRKRLAAGVDTGRRGLQPTRGSHFVEHALVAASPRIAEVYRRAWADALTKF